jgi:hypothetical protein
VDVSITPPRGRTIVVPRQTFPRSANSDLGGYHAVLEPYTNTGKLRNPRLADFIVES